MSRPTLVESLSVALAAYDLGGVEVIDPLPGEHGSCPHVVSAGAGRFLVRGLTSAAAVLRAVELRHAFAAHLAARGCRVPRLVLTREAEPVARVGEWAVEVQEFIEGRPLAADCPGDAALAGEALGALHRAGEGFLPPSRPRLSAEVELAQLARMEQQMQTYLPAPEAIEQMLHAKQCLADSARALANADLPVGMIHGDLRAEDLLRDRSGAVWITGFDACRWAPLLLDVADLARAFGADAVAEYARHRPLSEIEARLGAAASRLVLIRRGLAEGAGVATLAGRLADVTDW